MEFKFVVKVKAEEKEFEIPVNLSKMLELLQSCLSKELTKEIEKVVEEKEEDEENENDRDCLECEEDEEDDNEDEVEKLEEFKTDENLTELEHINYCIEELRKRYYDNDRLLNFNYDEEFEVGETYKIKKWYAESKRRGREQYFNHILIPLPKKYIFFTKYKMKDEDYNHNWKIINR